MNARQKRLHRRSTSLVAALGAATLTLGVTLVGTAGPAGAADADPTGSGSASQNLPGVPAPGSPDAAWERWAAAERAEAEATDWAADSAARGCELVDVTLTDEVDPDYNREMGAPADLATYRADIEEKCDDGSAAAGGAGGAERTTGEASTLALPGGTQCRSTSGPGTICVYKSSGRITASWNYRGSGSVSGFLRIYRVSTSSSGCPTGSTWLTGGSSTWSNGTTRTISKTRTSYGGYSAHVWKKTWYGHTDWGSACSAL